MILAKLVLENLCKEMTIRLNINDDKKIAMQNFEEIVLKVEGIPGSKGLR